MKKTDVYLHCYESPSDNIPEKYFPLLDTIRLESEWKEIGIRLGFKIRSDNGIGYKLVARDMECRLLAIVRPNSIDMKAISTRKKRTTHPKGVLFFLQHGSTYDDFAYLSEDVRLYCEASKHQEKSEYDLALQEIKKAIQIKPDENCYVDLLVELKLRNDDLSGIDDEMSYYAYDMDAMVHSGRTDVWMNLLIEKGRYQKAYLVIQAILTSLDQLIEGDIKNTRFSGQQAWFYIAKKESFTKNLSKLSVFGNKKKILEVCHFSKEFIQLIDLIQETCGHNNLNFSERIGDAILAWGEEEIARKHYESILNSPLIVNNQKLMERVQKKINKMNLNVEID